MNPIYLDNAATTRLDSRVREVMLPWLGELHGNPSSIHGFGQRASLAVNEARLAVANTMGCESEEVIFTSSATEANNMILRGAAHALRSKGNHIITTAIEHPCILNTCAALEREGFEVTYLSVDRDGRVDPADFQKVVKETTILASIHFANHEVGVIQPMKELIAIAKEADVIFHSDAVAAFPYIHTGLGKYPVNAMTLSPHKFHGPQGVGIAIVRAGVPLEAIITGGAQEFGKRAGTQNVPGIVGAGLAIALTETEKYDAAMRMKTLRDRALKHLQKDIPSLIVFGSLEYRLPNNLAIGVPGTLAENLLVELDLQGIAVSLGAACSSSSKEPSSVITALGYTPEEARSFLRITLSKETTEAELDRFVSTFTSIIHGL